MKLRFLLTLLGIFLVAGISAQDEHENRKNWSEGELTWNDFTEKTKSVGTSQLNYVIGYKTKKEKSGDTTLFRFDTYCYVDKNLSWVHKESKNDQILYYNQVIFDLAELQRRKLQYELDRVRYNYDAEYKLNQSYSDLNSEVNKFQFESDYGQDISVINKWHILIDNELKTYKNPSIPKFMKRNVGFAVHTGFGVGVFSGSMGEHFRPTFNFIYGFDLAFKKTILYLNATLAWSKVTNDYHTNQIWLIGQQAHFAILDMSLGYAIIDKSKLKLSPFIGLGITELTGKNNANSENTLRNVDYNFIFGLNADYKFRKKISLIPSSFIGVRESVETSIRARLYVTRVNYFDDLKGYSINLTIGISGFVNILRLN